MQIRPTSNVQNTQAVNLQPKTASTNSVSNNGTALPVDQLDISPQAQMMGTMAAGGEVRTDRVAELRAQIANGSYDSAEKLDAAVGRMLDVFA